MPCQICGFSLAAGQGNCPQCGAETGWSPQADPYPPGHLPLRGLANVLTVLLAVVIAAIVGRLDLRWQSALGVRWMDGLSVHGLDQLARYATIPLIIVFLVWFRRARIDADGRGWRQRRAQGWAIGGWIVPVVSFWFPFQIMGDIWRAGLPAEKRGKIAWLPALWWTSWLLAGVGEKSPAPSVTPNTSQASLIFLAIAAITLMALIRTVSDSRVGSPVSGAPLARMA